MPKSYAQRSCGHRGHAVRASRHPDAFRAQRDGLVAGLALAAVARRLLNAGLHHISLRVSIGIAAGQILAYSVATW